MANWGYVAIDKTGKEIKGSRDADTQEALTRDLKQQGLIVLEVKQQNTLTRDINISFDKKPAARDLAVFCRQFASIVRAGVSIIEALNMLAEQTENKLLQKSWQSVPMWKRGRASQIPWQSIPGHFRSFWSRWREQVRHPAVWKFPWSVWRSSLKSPRRHRPWLRKP